MPPIVFPEAPSSSAKPASEASAEASAIPPHSATIQRVECPAVFSPVAAESDSARWR